MPAPTFVAEYATAFDTATTPKTAMSAVAVNAGDVLVGIVVAENAFALPLALTENGAASWSSAQSDGTTDFASFILQTYPCSGETLTLTATEGGINRFGANVIRFSGTDGAGASNKAQGTTGSPSVTLTTTQANSAIVVVCTDWAAVAGTQTFTCDFGGTATALTDYPGDGANYGVAIAYFPDAGAVGAKTIGMSAPSGQKWNIAAIEVKGTPATGQFLRPASDITAGAWVASSGTLASCLDETAASDADYISTTANGTCRLALSSASTPDTGTRTFRFRAGGPADKKLIARILEDGTTVQTRTIDPLPGAPTDYAEVITGSITNYGAVQTEFEIADATTAPTVGPTFGAISAGANGGTTVAVPYPSGITAGMLLVLVMTSGATNSETPSTPAGWTSQGTDATTDGTFGVDTGPRRVTVFTKIADGTETGNLSVAITNGNTCRGTITRVSHAVAGYDWNIAATSGNDSTSGTGCSVTGGSIGWAPGDLLLISASQRVDSATQSAQSITASGVTFGTRTNHATTAVTTGNDHRHIIDTVAVTAGTTSAAPTYAYTASAAASVAVHFLRIREVPPTELGRVTFAEFEVPAAAGGAGSVSADADIRWSILAAVQADVDMRWALVNAAQADIDTRWALLTSAQADSDLRWALFNAAQADIDTRWALLASAQADSDCRWALFSAAQADIDTRWALLASAQIDADLRWQILSAVLTAQADLDARWGLLVSAQADSDCRWALFSAAQADIDMRWALLTSAQIDADLRWQILSAVLTAQADLDARWGLLVSAQADSDARWAILSAAQANIDARWSMLASVLADADARWAILAAAQGDMDARWAIIASVQADADARWALLVSAFANLDARWTMLASAQEDADMRWQMAGATATNINLQWTVGALAVLASRRRAQSEQPGRPVQRHQSRRAVIQTATRYH